MLVTTIAASHELAEAMLMTRSVKQHHPDAVIVVCLLEKRMFSEQQFPWVDRFVYAEDLAIADYNGYLSRYLEVQRISALKGYLLRYLAQTYGSSNQLVYLDSGMYIVSPLEELEKALLSTTVVLLPRLVEPSPRSACSPEITALTEGTFHAGILGLSRSGELDCFLDWWIRMIADLGPKEPYGGALYDQTYLNFVPSLFQTTVLRHPGYNVGAWNLHETTRLISRHYGKYTAGNEWLRCFHFSNPQGKLDQVIQAHASDSCRAAVRQLKAKHAQECETLRFQLT